MYINSGVVGIGARSRYGIGVASQNIQTMATAARTDGATVDETVFSTELDSLNSIVQERASLVLVPGLYKSGVIYAVNPAMAALIPLAFTRASTATRTNERGLIETVASGMPRLEYESESRNLLSHTEQFDNPAWIAQGTTKTANYSIAPNDTMTADRLVLAAGNNFFYQNFTFAAGTYTFSVWMKSNTGVNQNARLRMFDYTNQAYSAAVVTPNWTRFNITMTAIAAVGFPMVLTDGTNGLDISIWGAQLEVGSVATDYVTRKVKGYLFEKAATNLFLYSDQIDHASWTKSLATVTANTIIAPDGTQTADNVSNTVDGSSYFRRVTTIANSTSYTQSIYAKAISGNGVIAMAYNNGAINGSALFNLLSGTFTAPSFGSSAIQALPNGWYRCSHTFDTAATGTPFADIFYVAGYGGSPTATTIAVWGAQLETGSFATSYIPTVASQVTRVADFCSTTNMAFCNSAAGTLFSEFSFIDNTDQQVVNLTNGGLQFGLRKTTGNTVYLLAREPTARDVSFQAAITGNLSKKVAGLYSVNDLALTYGGLTPVIGSTYAPFTPTQLGIGNVGNAGVIKSIAYIPSRISNADLQAITTDPVTKFSKLVVADGGTVTAIAQSEYDSLHPIIKKKATLALIPGAYKSGVIYAMNPQTGSMIPLTFTRASTATRTNENGLIETVASGMPRLDYDPVTKRVKGYLFEKASTNVLPYSQEFDNAGWGKSESTISPNVINAPDGTLTADKLIESANAGIHWVVRSYGSTAGSAYTLSVFLKAGERTAARLLLNGLNVANTDVFVNLATGTIIQQTGTGATIENFGNGWFRVSVNGIALGVTIGAYIQSAINNSSNYQGDGTSGIYIWGAQLEQSSFATSYIPTGASQVTRVQDNLPVNTLTGYEATGTVLFNSPISQGALSGLGTWKFGATAGFYIIATQPRQGLFDLANGGYPFGSANGLLASPNLAFSYSASRVAMAGGGSMIGTDHDPIIAPTVDNVEYRITGIGHIKKMTVFNTAITDSELTKITQ